MFFARCWQQAGESPRIFTIMCTALRSSRWIGRQLAGQRGRASETSGVGGLGERFEEVPAICAFLQPKDRTRGRLKLRVRLVRGSSESGATLSLCYAFSLSRAHEQKKQNPLRASPLAARTRPADSPPPTHPPPGRVKGDKAKKKAKNPN